MQDHGSMRTSLSLFLSTLLHGSVIAVLAIGPTYLKGVLDGQGNSFEANESKGSTDVEILVSDLNPTSPPEVNSTSQTVQEPVTTAQNPPPTAAPVASPAEAEVVVKKTDALAPTAKMPEKKATPVAETKKPVTKKKITPVDFTQEEPANVQAQSSNDETNKIEPEPALAYDDTTEEVITHENHTPENNTSQKINDETAAPVTAQQTSTREDIAAMERPVIPPPTTAQPDAQTSAQASTQNNTSNGSAASTDSPGSQAITSGAAAPSGVVTQNYLTLRQVPGNKPPAYTTEMRLKQLQGRGQLVYFVSKSGEVSNIKLVRSTGSPELDAAAIQAFSKYKFVPGQEGYTVHDFEFVLKGPVESNRTRLRTSSR